MPSPWNRVYPRFAFSLAAGKPLRLLGIVLSLCLFLGLSVVGIYGGLVGLGRFGIGPFVALAARETEWGSFLFGAGVCALFAWLLAFSIRKQYRNLAVNLPGIEGHLEQVTEINESYEDGRGHCLSIKIHGKEYLLPQRLKKNLKAGRRVKIVLWAGSQEVRAVWVAW